MSSVEWRVDLIESEREWGSRVDETKSFPNKREAKDFTTSFNASNTEDKVPDWYMYATDPYSVVIEDKDNQ